MTPQRTICDDPTSVYSAFERNGVIHPVVSRYPCWDPLKSILSATLNVNLEEMDSLRRKRCYLRITSSLFMNVMH